MKINEVAKLTGVTVRTLHYYDEIGLLSPSEITESGYRLYNDEALEALQQILFFRELDFSLKDIKEIMADPHYNKDDALARHRDLLIQKRRRLDGLITLLDNVRKGDHTMSFQEFDMTEIDAAKNKYAAEAKERWGGTDAYKESENKTSAYDEAQWKIIKDEESEIFNAFAQNRHMSPDSQIVQDLVARWQNHISTRFYKCTNEILSSLGLMYVEDERFTKNIDKYGDGTAAFLSAAIEAYCKN